jgi:Domain of unknown function (DUF1877)
MGIYAHCRRVTPDQLMAMQQCRDTATLVKLLYQDFVFMDKQGYSWSDKCFGGINEALNLGLAPGTPLVLDIEHGGTPIGDFWIGYGHLRYFTPNELKVIVQDLRALGWKHTAAKEDRVYEYYEPAYEATETWGDEAFPFSYEEMMNIDSDNSLHYYLPSCERLVQLLQDADQAGEGVLFWIS